MVVSASVYEAVSVAAPQAPPEALGQGSQQAACVCSYRGRLSVLQVLGNPCSCLAAPRCPCHGTIVRCGACPWGVPAGADAWAVAVCRGVCHAAGVQRGPMGRVRRPVPQLTYFTVACESATKAQDAVPTSSRTAPAIRSAWPHVHARLPPRGHVVAAGCKTRWSPQSGPARNTPIATI